MAQSSYAEDYLRGRKARTGEYAESARMKAGYSRFTGTETGYMNPGFAPERERVYPRRSEKNSKSEVNIKAEALPKNNAGTTELTRNQLGIGVLCILIAVVLALGTVLANAHASSIKYSINQISHQNTVLNDEIRTLKRNVAKANSIEFVENAATTELGMVYPKNRQVVYITKDSEQLESLPEIIKEKAYKE